jgi:hypothetical protein
MALPNLNQKIFDLSFVKSRRNIIKTSPRRHESTFSLQKGLEILESMDFVRNSSHTKSKSLNIDFFKEYSKLEQELDLNEINMLGSSVSYYDQFQVYKKYLESISIIIKKKDDKLYKLLSRGLNGLEKAVVRLPDPPKATPIKIFVPEKPEVEKKDAYTQSAAEVAKPVSDIETVKELSKSFKKIKISRITHQLSDLYETLSALYTDIPSPTSTPDLEPIEKVDTQKIINLKLTVIRESIKNFIKHSERKPVQIDRESQTVKLKSNLVVALESMNQDKEIESLKYRNQINALNQEKEKLQQDLKRANNMCRELEDKNGTYEIELSRLNTKANELEKKLDKAEKINSDSEKKINEYASLTKSYKKNNKNLKLLVKKKQNDLQETLNKLCNTQVIWKIAEKKLKAIEKEWNKAFDKDFIFKDINITDISNKYGIQPIKLDNIDKEIEYLEQGDADVSYDIIEDQTIHLNIENAASRLNSRQNSEIFAKINSNLSNKSENFETFNDSSPRNQKNSIKKEEKKEKIQNNYNKNYKKHQSPIRHQETHEIHKNVTTEVIKQVLEVPNSNKKPSDFKIVINDNEITKNTSQDEEKKQYQNGNLEITSQELMNTSGNEINSSNPIKSLSNLSDKKGFKNLETKSFLKEKQKKPLKNQNSPQNNKKFSETMQKKHQDLKKPMKNIATSPYYESKFQEKTTSKSPEPSDQVLPNPETTDRQSPTLNSTFSIAESKNSNNLVESPSVELKFQINDKINSNPIRIPDQVQVKIKRKNNYEHFKAPSGSQSSHLVKFSVTNKLFEPKSTNFKDFELKETDDSKTETQNIMTQTLEHYKNFQIDSKDNLNSIFYDQKAFEEFFDTENLPKRLQQAENDWFFSMSEDQQKSYSIYQDKQNEYKIYKALNLSKSIQCSLLDPSDQLERLKNKSFYKELLERVFERPAELDALAPSHRLELIESFKGHEQEKCGEVCDHLKRAIAIKFKAQGKLYPIKTIKM